ncbi:conserved hypothetical protein [Mycoplasma haemofelis str. Langford 1]|uniref:Uncharacterized protein n=1 Tax=Mycoplasma haemofelis (strain Langford 1) TaxID=941640 RepID=E8ZKE3_MYCHL|nr:conserved hypothetical protein [Mycoplasma haemofelis str. Langford 1]
MESINHVNRYFFLRALAYPFTLPSFLFSYFRIRKRANSYVFHGQATPPEKRYEWFFSFHKKLLRLQKKSFVFLSDSKTPKNQTIFIIDKDISWDSLVVLRQLIKEDEHQLITPFLGKDILSKKSSLIIDLVDCIYDKEDLGIIFDLKRSLFISKPSFLSESHHIIKNAYFQIVLISSLNRKGEVFFKLGRAIKSQELAYLNKDMLSERLELLFGKLEKDLLSCVKNYDLEKRGSYLGYFSFKGR